MEPAEEITLRFTSGQVREIISASGRAVLINMKNLAIEIFGWYGAAAILGAYTLVSFSVLEPTSLLFQILNATGSLVVALASFQKRAFQPTLLNAVWMIIALAAITKMMF